MSEEKITPEILKTKSDEDLAGIQGCNFAQSLEYILVEKEWQRRLMKEQHSLNKTVVYMAAFITSIFGLIGVFVGAMLAH